MYSEEVNHYADSSAKRNPKTMLREIVVDKTEQSASSKGLAKLLTPSTFLSSCNLKNLSSLYRNVYKDGML